MIRITAVDESEASDEPNSIDNRHREIAERIEFGWVVNTMQRRRGGGRDNVLLVVAAVVLFRGY